MDRPKLRKVERLTLSRGEEQLLVLRDPLALSAPVALDADFAPVLDMLDGQRSVAQIRQSLLMRGTLDIPQEDLQDFVADLHDSGLLDDERFRQLWEAEHRRFVEAPRRPAQLAGTFYPETRDALQRLLDDLLPHDDARFDDDSELVGVLCPHQPLDLAGSVLDQTLRGLPPASALEAIIVLGTDHSPGLTPFALCDKDYDTPLGPVRAARRVVQAMDRRLDWVLREQMRHRQAASLELTAVLLRHLYGDECPPVLMVACGLTALSGGDAQSQVDEFIGNLEVLFDDERVLWWTSAELSHAGPAYGHAALDATTREAVVAHDHACLESLMTGRPEQLMRRCLEDHGQGRPSGTAALNTLCRLLPVGYRASLAAYETLDEPAGQPGQLGMAGVQFFSS